MAVLTATPGLRRWLAAWGLVCCALVTPARAQPSAALHEYELKAVFLFNFAHFVEWPAGTFPEAQTPLVIGVLGEDPFGSFLDEAVRGEKVLGRSLVIRRYRTVAEATGCHILFVSRSEAGRLDEIFAALKGRSILTVGEIEGFAASGGMIRFVKENNRVRLRINLAAAQAAQLKLSSKLLRPADIVAPGKD